MKKYINITADGYAHSEVYLQDDVDPAVVPGVTPMPVELDYVLPAAPNTFSCYHLARQEWIDPRSLVQFCISAWARIKRARDIEGESPLITPFGVFDAGARGLAGINRASSLAAQLQVPVDFTMHDNQVALLGAAELAQVALMLVQREQALRNKATALRARIDAVTTKSELDLISW